MKRIFLAAALALVVGVPCGWILTFMSTPLLWKLEPILGMELAGHSGPSDWVFLVGWAVMVPAVFAFFYAIMRPKAADEGHDRSRAL